MEKLPDATPLAFCIIDDRAIFLDVDGDRYFSLPARLNRAFVDGLAHPDGLRDEDREHLIRLGILVEAARGLPAVQPRLCSPTQMIEPTDPRRMLFLAAITQSRMRFRVRYWRFARIIRTERHRRRTEQPPAGTLEPARLYASFCALAAWFGEEDQCLARALAYRMIAMKHGHEASLVIGVKLDPFAAHCWVQNGDSLLNDRLERVRLFTPILVC